MKRLEDRPGFVTSWFAIRQRTVAPKAQRARWWDQTRASVCCLKAYFEYCGLPCCSDLDAGAGGQEDWLGVPSGIIGAAEASAPMADGLEVEALKQSS